MSEYRPKEGDRVRLSVEGIVRNAGGAESLLIEWGPNRDVFLPERLAYRFSRSEIGDGISVEKLPDPEPGFFPLQPGDVVQVSGTTYVITRDGVRIAQSGERPGNDRCCFISGFSEWLAEWHKNHPTLTCALLVRNGEAVG